MVTFNFGKPLAYFHRSSLLLFRLFNLIKEHENTSLQFCDSWKLIALIKKRLELPWVRADETIKLPCNDKGTMH